MISAQYPVTFSATAWMKGRGGDCEAVGAQDVNVRLTHVTSPA